MLYTMSVTLVGSIKTYNRVRVHYNLKLRKQIEKNPDTLIIKAAGRVGVSFQLCLLYIKITDKTSFEVLQVN